MMTAMGHDFRPQPGKSTDDSALGIVAAILLIVIVLGIGWLVFVALAWQEHVF